MDKRLKRIILGLLTLVLAVLAIRVCHRYESRNNSIEVKSSMTSEQKEKFKYDYEIANTYNVLDIISYNELLIEEENKLKVYNLKEEKFTNELMDISKDSSVYFGKAFDKGIVWVENNQKEKTTSKVFIKYFEDKEVIELDSSNSNIVPSISVTSNYLTYYIIDNKNIINVKFYNLKEKCSKIISSYELENDEGEIYISTPNTNNNEIVWSGIRRGKGNIYSYSIKEDVINILSKESVIANPVIKEGRMFAIEMFDYYDSEIDSDYASDFIVEYNYETNTWDKFEEERIDNYVEAPQECVVKLSSNQGQFLTWLSTFEVRYIYDSKDDEFISLFKEKSDLMVNIYILKNNILYYKAHDYENNESGFIYIIPDN